MGQSFSYGVNGMASANVKAPADASLCAALTLVAVHAMGKKTGCKQPSLQQ